MNVSEKKELKKLIQEVVREEKPERCLTVSDIAKRLKVCEPMVRRNLHKLEAKGVQRVPMSFKSIRFLESSFDTALKRAAERNEPLI